jgi:WD40 repeat protein
MAVAFAGGGRLLLTAADDGTANVWEAATGKLAGPPLKHADSLRAIAGTRDGQKVLTGGVDGVARLWDRKRGKLVHELRSEGPIWAVAFSPDGRRLATGSDNVARVWDAATGEPLTPPLRHLALVRDLIFSPDCQMLLTASWDKTARLWDAATGKRIGPHLQHPDVVHSAGFGPDGQTIVTMAGDSRVRTWNVATRLADEPARLTLWVQVLTSLNLDRNGGVHVLSTAAWQQRRKELAVLGGSPLR